MPIPLVLLAVYAASPSTMFAAGTGLVLAGTFVRWRLTDTLCRAEEHIKEGRLTEDQARLRVAIARYTGPVMILGGLTVFLVVLSS